MSKLIGIKFKFYFNIFLQAIFSLILSIFIPIYITLHNSNSSIKSVYGIIVFLLLLILFNAVTIIYLNFNYFICNIIGVYDKDFSQKQNYFFSYIKDKMYQGSIMQIISNSIKYTFSNNYDELLRFSPSDECIDTMTGGALPETSSEEKIKNNNSKIEIPKKINPVPGSNLNNINNEKNISEAKSKLSELSELSKSPLQNILALFSLDIVKKRFEENPKWSGNLKSYLFLLLIFFIIGSILDLTFISKSNMKGINFLVSLLVVIVSYFPLIFSFAAIGSILVNNNIIKIIILFLSGISLILSIFGIPFVKSSAKENWVFWVVIICFVLNIFLIIIGKLMSKAQSIGGDGTSGGTSGGTSDGTSGGTSDGTSDGNNNALQASAPELQQDNQLLQKILKQKDMQLRFYEEEIKKYTGRNINSTNNIETVPTEFGRERNTQIAEPIRKKNNNKELNNILKNKSK